MKSSGCGDCNGCSDPSAQRINLIIMVVTFSAISALCLGIIAVNKIKDHFNPPPVEIKQ